MASNEFAINYFGRKENTIPSKEHVLSTVQKYRRHFIKFTESLPKNAKVLDAGCGNCKFTKIMLAIRPDLVVSTMDITNVTDFVPKDIGFKQGSVDDVDSMYDEDMFDAIICCHVIEHLVYPIKMIQGFKKILKNNGLMYLETPNWSRSLIPFLDTFFWNDYTHIRLFSKNTLERLMNDFSFDIEKLISISSQTLFIKKIKNNPDHTRTKTITSSYKKKTNVIKKIFKRIIGVFLYDILILVAKNKKNIS